MVEPESSEEEQQPKFVWIAKHGLPKYGTKACPSTKAHWVPKLPAVDMAEPPKASEAAPPPTYSYYGAAAPSETAAISTEVSDDEEPDLRAAFAAKSWASVEQAVKEDKQAGDIKTSIDEEIDDPAAEPNIMWLSVPEAASGSQAWPWAPGQEPSEL